MKNEYGESTDYREHEEFKYFQRENKTYESPKLNFKGEINVVYDWEE